MSNSSLRSLRPLLIGSLVVLSVACQRADDRSQPLDTTSPAPSTRSSESAPMPTVIPDPRAGSADLNREERMPVAGRDDMIDLGTGGSTSTGGSSGNGGGGGSHHH